MAYTVIRKMLKWLPDKQYLQIMYFKNFRRFIDFRDPKTYNEKLQWLKLYNRDPAYVQMVDKIEGTDVLEMDGYTLGITIQKA